MLTWPDAANGLNHEQALVQTSTDRGANWSTPVNAAEAGDRPDNPAVAISPNGTDLYLVYNAYLDPFQTTTANPRRMQGVTRHADVGAGGTLGAFATLHRAAIGDARGTTRTLNREAIYDYQYAAAAPRLRSRRLDGRPRRGGVPRGGRLPTVPHQRQPRSPPPSPLTDCPATFGNLDIYSGSFVDPTP